ncbi:tetratricopeptide repeat protein [Candidatus Uabimicrobium sp. HlEnr_7]|uniref:protein kinase domain-containing protein n=1 Tax=Candidatus Uabimicrobium helgolandensis TaxID=3095367 RepID=UPI0035586DE3
MSKTIKQKQFGKYVVCEQLGRGGMGVVYRAYDTIMKRVVALKLIAHNDQSDLERFVNESQVMAKLSHVNTVRFYEFSYQPQPYCAMEYVEGVTLGDLIHNRKLSPNLLVDMLIKVCDALHEAHSYSIIHRDIKPANIMVDSQGEPKLMDFGLAKNNKESQKITKSQAIIGTIHYMPPEQLDGHEASPRSDLYAIGAILYEGITQRTLYQGNSNVNIMVQILEGIPIPPRQLNPDISPYLEAICLKCIAKKPQKRYLNARQLARELRNYRENRSIIAKKYSRLDQMRQVIHHNKILCSFIVLVLAFLLSFAVYSSVKEKQLRIALDQLQVEKNNALLAKKTTEKTSQNLQKLNTAMIEALNYASYSNLYPGLLVDKDFIRPIKRVFEQSKLLQNAEEYKFLRGIVLAQGESLQHLQTAVRDFSNQIDDDPRQVIAYLNRAKTYQRMKKFDLALRDFEKCLDIEPRYAEVYFARGTLYEETQQFSLALADYSTAISYNPNTENAFLNRGNIYKDHLEKYNLAFADYSRFIQLKPNLEQGHINIALLYEKTNQYEKAFSYYERIFRILPGASHSYYARGNLFLKTKQYEKALKDYDRALKISPEKKMVYHNRSSVHRKLGNEEQALQDLEKFITAYPEYASSYYNRGNIYRNLGNQKKALHNYNEAIKRNTKYRDAYLNRGNLYYDVKEYALALSDYESAKNLGYKNKVVEKKILYLKQILNK